MTGELEGERGFAVLLEEVRSQYRALSERVQLLDQRVDREVHQVRREVEVQLKDLRTGIKSLVRDVREHRHSG